MARKTVDVETLKRSANYYLNNPDTTPEGREGVAGLIESALHLSGNYKGFRYTDPAYLFDTLDSLEAEAARTKLCNGGYDQTIRTYY